MSPELATFIFGLAFFAVGAGLEVLGWTSPTVGYAFLGIGGLLAISSACVFVLSRRKKPQTTTENPSVSFTVHQYDNRRSETHIHYHADAYEAETKTFIKFRPGATIDNAMNVSSLTDSGTGDFTINFVKPLNVNTLVVHPMEGTSRIFKVIEATANYVHLVFEGEEPEMIALRFDD